MAVFFSSKSSMFVELHKGAFGETKRFVRITALMYLSRYLYRGVISEKNIIANKEGLIRFKYVESRSGRTKFRTLPGEDFLRLMLQHMLPRGFRRVREFGFLHNAKKLLSLLQLILHVIITEVMQRPRPIFKCLSCQANMHIVEFRRKIVDLDSSYI